MISIQPKIHDQQTLEFKVGYIASKGTAYNSFEMNTWIYIPETLDVNRHTYPKESFYRDVLSYVRLITPDYPLSELSSKSALPFVRLSKACESVSNGLSPESREALASEVKMFASIAKSSIRDAYREVSKARSAGQIDAFVSDIRHLLENYRSLFPCVVEALDYGDEFISNVVEQHAYHLLKDCGGRTGSLQRLLADEHAYRMNRGFLCVEVDSADSNSQFLYHAGQLKKYIESNLYLPTHKRRNAVFLEQAVFSLAAGLSMVFATVISFAFQQTYGNFTLPFFIALVISYMFKDRIKELVRMYFSTRLSSRLFDYKIQIRVGNRQVGLCKEGFDFVQPDKVPRKVRLVRNRHRPLVVGKGVDEQVIQYRKRVHLNRKEVSRLSPYPLKGINDIFRINLSEFMRKMDNPEIPLFARIDDSQFSQICGEKVYYLNFVIQLKYDSEMHYHRYRICLNRQGIKSIEIR